MLTTELREKAARAIEAMKSAGFAIADSPASLGTTMLGAMGG